MYKIFTAKTCRCHSYAHKRLFITMNLTFVFMLLALMEVSATAIAQRITLNEKNAALKPILEKITKQSGYEIIYDSDVLSTAKNVTINVHDASIEEALTLCMQNQGLSYLIKDRTIIIVPKRIVKTQNEAALQVKGIVTDESKQPLPGVNIRIKGGAVGAVSLADGRFTINVPDKGTILVFSMLGFETREVTINDNQPLTIVLKQVTSRLDDIVVVGYGTQRKADLTGSVASVKANEIQQAKSVSFMEAMQGRLAGVQVTSSSGEPGAAANITIRGTNSFNSGTQPLYVIDGVQIDVNNAEAASSGLGSTALTNPLAGISPNDIASIEVLKDASATAIFGSRGANGVIVITTKSGKANTSSFEFNNYTGFAWAPKHILMLGAQDYASYRLANNTADQNYAIDTNGDQIYDQVKDLSSIESHDWQKEALRTAITQNYGLSFSGGTAKTNFFTSASYLNQQGLIINNNFERYGLLMKVNHNVTDRLRLSANVNLSHATGRGVASNGGNDVRNYNGLMQMLLITRPLNAPDPAQLALDPDGAAVSSPVDFANLSYKKSPLSRVLTDIGANYRIINGLNLDVRGSAVITQSENNEFYPGTVSWGFPTNGLAFLNTSKSINWYQTSTLTYNKRFAKVHSLNALAGFEMNFYDIETFSLQGRGFDIQSVNPVFNFGSVKLIPVPPATSKVRNTRVSQFFRVNYGYNDKYLLTATIRNDASSRLADGRKSSLFPSAGLAWRVSKESFLQNNKVVSDLKLRGSFGVTGNERIPAYQYFPTFGQVFYASATGAATLGIAPNTVANPDLKWETTYAYDLGFDLSLFKDRITLTADAYLKQTKDLLVLADIPAQSGFLRQYQNLGQVDNKGIELALNTINIRKGNFSWSSNINVSINRNKVISLGGVPFIPVTVYGGPIGTLGRVTQGQPIGTGYGYVFDGIYQLNDFVITNAAGTVINPSAVTDANLIGYTYTPKPGVPRGPNRNARPGDIKFKDLNNDGLTNSSDAQVITNSNPKHYGGFSNNFTYKNFDLSVLFNWSYGNDILYVGRGRIEAGQSTFANPSGQYWFNRWTVANPSNTYPGISSQGRLDVSSYYKEDGSFLRLRNLTLGYNLNETKALRKIGIKGLRVYATGVNLYTWTNYSGFDPEINSYTPLLPGVDNISYPRERSIIFGLNIKL
ncbi:SusC/RagA family TonB-linked outer membrane protein [Mucilaginibacter sp. HME9299]|uniref:SusC/RagA family TonB-linked outer membrane protein n=2 Tax=Mucilaginibacter aquatilis TaxID=1517760 RepID=A0A6I4IQ72_9SPHI|nr:SusC/RagA family TonB-linked outer membrane protein [Mucilaginibacter aquatilis]